MSLTDLLTYLLSETECAILQQLIFSFVTRKPWLAAINHPKRSIVLSHGLSRLASRKDYKPAVRGSKPRLWSLLFPICYSADWRFYITEREFS